MEKGKRYIGVAIIIAGLDQVGEFERATALRSQLLGERGAAKRGRGKDKNSGPSDCDAVLRPH